MSEAPAQYECRCGSCHQSFMAESKHRVTCPACVQQEIEDREDDNFDDLPDEDEDDLTGCGMMANGQCTEAGTEWCDWSCPRNKL